jgi:myosin-5
MSLSPRGSIFASPTLTQQQRTISSVFMHQLGELMKTLKNTEAHYVRCIRPNESNLPNIFDACVVNEQLKNCGIYETVKLRRMGYAYRIKHQPFIRRYAVCVSNFNEYLIPGVLSPTTKDEDLADKCRKLIANIEGITANSWQVGKTKVFLNERVHPLIENIRSKYRPTCVCEYVC